MSEAKSYLSSITDLANVTLQPNDFVSMYDRPRDVFFDLSMNACSIIQIGNRHLTKVTSSDLINKCRFSFADQICKIRFSPLNKNNYIASIKGQLSLLRTLSDSSSKINIYEIKQEQLYQMKLFPHEGYLSKELSFRYNEPVNSVSVLLVHVGREFYWVDILLRPRYPQHSSQHIEYVSKLHENLNVIPRITEYGPTLFSDADILLKLSKSSWKESSPYLGVIVEIMKGSALSYYKPDHYSDALLTTNLKRYSSDIDLKVEEAQALSYRRLFIPHSKYHHSCVLSAIM